MKSIVLLLAVLLITLSEVNAQSNFGKNRGMNLMRSDSMRQGMFPERIQRQLRIHQPGLAGLLDLNKEQVQAFKEMKIKMYKETQPIRNQLGEAMARQKTLTSSDKPDMDAINKNLERIGELRTEIEKIRTRYNLEMRSQLNDEQRMKLDGMKGKGRSREGFNRRGMQNNFNPGRRIEIERRLNGINWPEREIRLKEG